MSCGARWGSPGTPWRCGTDSVGERGRPELARAHRRACRQPDPRRADRRDDLRLGARGRGARLGVPAERHARHDGLARLALPRRRPGRSPRGSDALRSMGARTPMTAPGMCLVEAVHPGPGPPPPGPATSPSQPDPRVSPMRRALGIAAAVALTVTTTGPAVAAAQETSTERSAAADVIRRMNELERSLALPQLVARLTARDARRDAVVARARELMDRELLAMADDITRHPEVGHKEERSVKILTDYLRAHDFDVETGVAGLKTAFVARYKKGTPGPNLGVILEYDALRGTTRDFHGDQHSAQGPVGMAAAIAVAEFLSSSKTAGTVTVYGTPAEEVGAPEAKTTMYEAGVFKGADVLVRSHSSTGTQRSAAGFGSCCMNIDVVHYTFAGAPAHQLQAWEGRDALLGVIELFNHIDALRKNLRPEARIQGIITEGGKAPNVVPDRAAAEVWIRYPDEVRSEERRVGKECR